MTSTRTPGHAYFVRQGFPSLHWQVIQLEQWQAELMRERGAPIFETSAQAHAVAAERNRTRTDQLELELMREP